MYAKLQHQAKDHIVGWLNNNSDGFVFDIDTCNPNTTIIKCQTPSESIEIVIGQTDMPSYVVDYIIKRIGECAIGYRKLFWVFLIRRLIQDIFKIYGFNIYKPTILHSKYKIMNIWSQIYAELNDKMDCYDMITPFSGNYTPFIEKLVNKCPLLVLLNPIEYYHCFSLVTKEQNLQPTHTVGLYELFLARFPEKDPNLFGTYLVVYSIFQPCCPDIIYLILTNLIHLLQPIKKTEK